MAASAPLFSIKVVFAASIPGSRGAITHVYPEETVQDVRNRAATDYMELTKTTNVKIVELKNSQGFSFIFSDCAAYVFKPDQVVFADLDINGRILYAETSTLAESAPKKAKHQDDQPPWHFFAEVMEKIRQGQEEIQQESRQIQQESRQIQEESLRIMKELKIDAMSVSFSKVSEARLYECFRHYKLSIVDADRQDFIPDDQFETYDRGLDEIMNQKMNWGLNEVLSTPDALEWIKNRLLLCRASLYGTVIGKDNSLARLGNGNCHYKLVNVASDQKHLHLHTDSTRLTGGLDGVIMPKKTSKLSFLLQMRVGIELKHPEQVETEPRWQQAIYQACVQMIAANVQSFHPVMHLLTDLKSNFLLLKIVGHELKQFVCPDAATAYKCLSYWLSCCDPHPAFVYEENRQPPINPELMPSMLASIRLQQSSVDGGLKGDYRLDILDDLEPTERAHYFFQSFMNRFTSVEQ